MRATASCIACRLRPDVCVCAHAPRLRVATRVVVIMHSKEWRRSTNTGHLARLAIQDSEVRLHGKERQTVACADINARSPSTLALYPGRGAHVLSLESAASLPRPLTLLVPDGNWGQAKNMMRRLSLLSNAQAVRLKGPRLALDAARHNCCADRMSTFQAIAQAIGILEGRNAEMQMLRFFQRVLAQMYNSRRFGRHGRSMSQAPP